MSEYLITIHYNGFCFIHHIKPKTKEQCEAEVIKVQKQKDQLRKNIGCGPKPIVKGWVQI